MHMHAPGYIWENLQRKPMGDAAFTLYWVTRLGAMIPLMLGSL